MSYDGLIRGGTIVTEHGVQTLDVAIRDGKIAALLAPGTEAAASEVIDASGQYVLPGAVDIHFHCRAPAYPQRGDFATETRAAAAGDEIWAMVEEGAIAFKIFMTAAPAGRDDEFEGLCLPDSPSLYQALKLVAETGLVTTIHAEDNALLEWHTAQLKAAGRNDITAHGESRPPHVEALGISTVLSLNDSAGAKIHIAHVSCRAALDTLRKWERAGADVSGETCPHYLFFTEDDLNRVGPYGKINPPLRHADDQVALWEGLHDGSLIAITTDHSPFTVEEKERDRNDIWRTPPGAPGVEELLLGVMDQALRGKITLEQAVAWTSANGAKRFGIYPNKGTIAVGADADIVVYDPHQTTTITQDVLFSKAKACDKLYEGRTFQGKVRRTLVNGRTVFADGEIHGQPSWGKFVRPNTTRLPEGHPQP